MTDEEIRATVASAIDRVRNEDPPLELSRVHERSTAHRLAVHMEAEYGRDWNVDCEYDRDGKIKKAVEGVAECDDRRKTDDILPDIIVHHRRKHGRAHNLLVIELKKSAAADPCDRRKLELLTYPDEHYGYQLGLYINIDGGNFTCTWYKDGKRIG